MRSIGKGDRPPRTFARRARVALERQKKDQILALCEDLCVG